MISVKFVFVTSSIVTDNALPILNVQYSSMNMDMLKYPGRSKETYAI